MKPSIGRIVHYYPQPKRREGQFNPGRPIAAIVTYVSEDKGSRMLVGLTTFPHAETPKSLPAVLYSETPQPGYWSWPPRV